MIVQIKFKPTIFLKFQPERRVNNYEYIGSVVRVFSMFHATKRLHDVNLKFGDSDVNFFEDFV